MSLKIAYPVRVCVVLASLMAASVPAQATQRPPLTAVVADRSIGTVTLGMPYIQVWKHLGKPTEIHFLHCAGRSYTCDFWDSKSSGKREKVILYRGRVVQVERDVTDEENRRNLFSSIRRRHPHLTVMLYKFQNEAGSVLIVDDVRKGIAWALFLPHTDDFSMHLFNDVGPDRIIIHKAGRIALPNAGEKLNAPDPLTENIRAWFAAKTTHTNRGN